MNSGFRVQGSGFRAVFLLFTIHYLLFTLTGCGPTYSKEVLEESIIKICKKEYKVDVKVATVGKTVAIYLPVNDLWDFTFGVNESALKKIWGASMAARRVTVSTNADYDFYCIIAHDMRIPELQFIAINHIDDFKRAYFGDISIIEFQKRMLYDRKINPQSQKEYAIKDVFEKMHLDKKMQETVMNDFFRSDPATMGDIGYWNGRFYLKDITLSEFLAEQMAFRINVEVATDKKLSEGMLIKSMKGSYVTRTGGNYFRIEFLAERKWLKETKDLDIGREIFQKALEVSHKVLHGYRFEDYDYVEIVNQLDGKKMKVLKEDLKKFRPKKTKIEDVMTVETF